MYTHWPMSMPAPMPAPMPQMPAQIPVPIHAVPSQIPGQISPMQTMAPIIPTQLPYQQHPAYQYEPQLYNEIAQKNRQYIQRVDGHAKRVKKLLMDVLGTEDGKLHVMQALVDDKKKTNRTNRVKMQMAKIDGILEEVLQKANAGNEEPVPNDDAQPTPGYGNYGRANIPPL